MPSFDVIKLPHAPASSTAVVSGTQPAKGPSTEAVSAAIASWEDLGQIRRDNLMSAIRVIDRIAKAPRFPEDAPACREFIRNGWTCAGVNAVVWRHPPAFWNLGNTRFQAILSDARFVLRRLGLHADAGWQRNKLNGPWQDLHDTLPTEERRRGLILFARYCVLHEISPQQVGNNVLSAFEVWCCTGIIHNNAAGLTRRVASGWNWAAAHVADWPATKLQRANMRDEYVLQLTGLPPSFAESLDHFLAPLDGRVSGIKTFAALAAAAAAGIPPAQRRAKPLRPRTIEAFIYRVRLCATALAAGGIPPETIKTLGDLIHPLERTATILEFHQNRLIEKSKLQGKELSHEDARSTNLAGIADTLRQIAQFHAHRPETEIDYLKDLAALVRPPQQTEMTEKNARRLRDLKETSTNKRFLHLPKLWMTRAADTKYTQKQRASWALYAVALEILQVTSFRRCEVIGLNINTDLRRQRPGGPVTHITVPAKNVKGGRKAATVPLPPESAQLLEHYLRKHRPILTHSDNAFLFPANEGLGHRNDSEFSTQLRERVGRELGVEFNVHLPRHMTVDRLLELFPGNYGLPSKVMRHKTSDTTRNSYAGLEADAAARIAADSVIDQRRRLRPGQKSPMSKVSYPAKPKVKKGSGK